VKYGLQRSDVCLFMRSYITPTKKGIFVIMPIFASLSAYPIWKT